MEWLIPDVQLLCSPWAWTTEPARRELGSGGGQGDGLVELIFLPFPALGSDGIRIT
jgi:hypothetical protein